MPQQMPQQIYNQVPRQMNPMQQNIPPHILEQMQQQNIQKNITPNTPNTSNIPNEHFNGADTGDDFKNLIYTIRVPLVLLLLVCIILTPQMNSILNNIPYTSNVSYTSHYPNQIGILLRGIILVCIFVVVQKLKLI